jgi:hypothetical protein
MYSTKKSDKNDFFSYKNGSIDNASIDFPLVSALPPYSISKVRHSRIKIEKDV